MLGKRPLAYIAAVLCALAYTGCVQPAPYVPPGPGPTPWTPVPTPPPAPVDPGPVTPPTTGSIDEATFAALTVGMTEAQVVALAGPPFRKHDAAGFTIFTYTFDAARTGFLWMKAGALDHKTRMP